MKYRPKISVCMAAYQGENYISLQLRSILGQLSADDEVIVVDDGSTDHTCGEVAALQDARLVLMENNRNQGVLRAFESALSSSSGEIVFLSDQDDLWFPKKVETVLQVFANDPDLMLVASDAILVDEDGAKIGDSFYAKRGTLVKFADWKVPWMHNGISLHSSAERFAFPARKASAS